MRSFDEKYPTQTGPHGFIQWKGTGVCADLYCSCGKHSHIDEEFAYKFRCACGKVWHLNPHIQLVEATPEEAAHGCDPVMEDLPEALAEVGVEQAECRKRILPTPEPREHLWWPNPRARDGWERAWASGHWADDEIWAQFLEIPEVHIVWELRRGYIQHAHEEPFARGAAKTLEIAHSRAERAAVLLKQVWKLEGERDEDKPYYRALPHFNLVKGA